MFLRNTVSSIFHPGILESWSVYNFFQSFLPSVENFLENWNILPSRGGRGRDFRSKIERETSVAFPPLVYPVFIRTGWILYPLYALTIRCFLLWDEADASCHARIFPSSRIFVTRKLMKFIRLITFPFVPLLFYQYDFHNFKINISFLGKNSKDLRWMKEKKIFQRYFCSG